MTPEYILHQMSYANLMLYSSIIPSEKSDKKKQGINGYSEETDACRPGRFTETVIKKR